MNIFDFDEQLVKSYSDFSKSFTLIDSDKIKSFLDSERSKYTPSALIQINPNYKQNLNEDVQSLVNKDILHPKCRRIFATDSNEPLKLYQHQVESISLAKAQKSYVVTTGTGSGKSLCFFIPIVDRILREKANDLNRKTRAIIVYPMNALANSQFEEIRKFTSHLPDEIKVSRYTGQESKQERDDIKDNPPDILLTNYVMLDYLLMRSDDKKVINNAKDLNFLVLDELHTYRGRSGADVSLLIRRLRSQLTNSENLICIGTSATMSSEGSIIDQQKTVARVASTIFGVQIEYSQVVKETLQRVTSENLNKNNIKETLRNEIKTLLLGKDLQINNFEEFQNCSLAVWLELTLSISTKPGEESTRAVPQDIRSIARELNSFLDNEFDESDLSKVLKDFLIRFGEDSKIKTPQNRNPFAFKLHQFLSGPEKLSMSLEKNQQMSLDGQMSVKDKDDENSIIPMYRTYFCPECGQEYHPVLRIGTTYFPVEIDDISNDEEHEYGYICKKTNSQTYRGEEDLPQSWFDYKKQKLKIKQSRKKRIPETITLNKHGRDLPNSGDPFYWFLRGKFRFCVNCCKELSNKSLERNALIGLSGEGRSSVSTILCLNQLRQLDDLKQECKILGFSDNRQDAALQAGHFNDYVSHLILRVGLLNVLEQNKDKEFSLEELTDSIFRAFHFDSGKTSDIAKFSRNPYIKNFNLLHAQEVVRNIISLNLLKELKSSNMYNRPSIDKLELAEIKYENLEKVCNYSKIYLNFSNNLLNLLSPQELFEVLKLVLDTLRNNLCIKSPFFDENKKNSLYSNNIELTEKFQLDENESFYSLGKYAVVGTTEDRYNENKGLVSISDRNSLGKKIIEKLSIFNSTKYEVVKLKSEDKLDLIANLLNCMATSGLLIEEQSKKISKKLYTISDRTIKWKYKTPSNNALYGYFKKFYLKEAQKLSLGSDMFGIEAQEHTAQLSNEDRLDLERRFRANENDFKEWNEDSRKGYFKKLPLLFCSPTMELGIDISNLNFVFLRNVPPTPANYVQRAGRAGRSGQQSLTTTYCTSLSPHDQWYFRRPNEMVQGRVNAPKLDIKNQTMVENHIHSIFVSCISDFIKDNVADNCDLNNDAYPLNDDIKSAIYNVELLKRAKKLATEFISELDLSDCQWFNAAYVDKVIQESPIKLDRAFDFWRSLLKACVSEKDVALKNSNNIANTKEQNRHYERIIQECSIQISLLKGESSTKKNNDFYTYRYLANQGFLPGFNFPTMPLVAWLKDKKQESNLLTRSRFIGLTEFGPRNIIYHKGKTYRVTSIKLKANSISQMGGINKLGAYICPHCGYFRDSSSSCVDSICINCGNQLSLEDYCDEYFKVEAVSAYETHSISCEDEVRKREGFITKLAYSYRGHNKEYTSISNVLDADKNELALIEYSESATIYKINEGWKSGSDLECPEKGFRLNALTGVFEKPSSTSASEEDDTDEYTYDSIIAEKDVIQPYVSDVRNILLIKPTFADNLEADDKNKSMATLKSALKQAITHYYQLEQSEIAIEYLPSSFDRSILLIYENTEGGAGVLKDLSTSLESLKDIAKEALSLMHYQLDEQGNLIDREPDCLKACYKCLLAYDNQTDHAYIDRHDTWVLNFLQSILHGTIEKEQCCKAAISSHQLENITAATESLSRLDIFKSALMKFGCSQPSDYDFMFKSGIKVSARYKSKHMVVLLDKLSEDELSTLEDNDWIIIDLSDESDIERYVQSNTEKFSN